jgi:hypothetical protein
MCLECEHGLDPGKRALIWIVGAKTELYSSKISCIQLWRTLSLPFLLVQRKQESLSDNFILAQIIKPLAKN